MKWWRLEVSPKKAELITALLEKQVPPCPPYVLSVLYAEMKGKRAREKPPTIVAGPPVQGPERVGEFKAFRLASKLRGSSRHSG